MERLYSNPVRYPKYNIMIGIALYLPILAFAVFVYRFSKFFRSGDNIPPPTSPHRCKFSHPLYCPIVSGRAISILSMLLPMCFSVEEAFVWYMIQIVCVSSIKSPRLTQFEFILQ
jgi:hypothetical protein